MGKGFGKKSEEQLGYLLLLIPEVKAYAGKFTIDYKRGDDEEFIGIVNRLEDAQVWKTIKQAKQAVEKYADFLLEEAEKAAQSQVRIEIRRLKRLVDGKLIDESVELLFLSRRSS
jgi:hypothetical protein